MKKIVLTAIAIVSLNSCEKPQDECLLIEQEIIYYDDGYDTIEYWECYYY